MAAALNKVVTEFQALSKEWAKKSRDLAKVGRMVEQLKFSLTDLMFLPTEAGEASVEQLTISRDFLEIGAQYAVLIKDIPGFERYMEQLKTYYLDYPGLTESPYKYQLLGLNLLCLLSQNRVAEFHTELERLPAAEIQGNVYITHPVSLEQYMMEGRYNKVLLAKDNVPAEHFKYFIDILMTTVRDEIASCLERAYHSISFAEAARMLNLNQSELTKYAKSKGWEAEGSRLYYRRGEKKEAEDLKVPSHELANLAITYAREMEQIV